MPSLVAGDGNTGEYHASALLSHATRSLTIIKHVIVLRPDSHTPPLSCLSRYVKILSFVIADICHTMKWYMRKPASGLTSLPF